MRSCIEVGLDGKNDRCDEREQAARVLCQELDESEVHKQAEKLVPGHFGEGEVRVMANAHCCGRFMVGAITQTRGELVVFGDKGVGVGGAQCCGLFMARVTIR